MEKLTQGDKVVHISYNRHARVTNYVFETVERVTATQAVLSNGKRLKNEPVKDRWSNNIVFHATGNRDSYTLQTPEILTEARKEKERRTALDWFSGKKFTDEEIKIIYNTFKEQEKSII